MNKALTLYELNSLVRETIEVSLTHEYWVEAELSEVREVRGHCYMQLVQFDEMHDGFFGGHLQKTLIAQAPAKCWKSQWMMIRPHFERITGQHLHAGMKVLMKVYAQFHENYGFSWIVTDMDPAYTMGDMARKRLEIVRQLKENGVFDLNKELPLPMFAQRIAVVSSAGAAGYGDFVKQLEENEYGFRFHIQLFPAVMQGEQVEESVIAALDAINLNLSDYDCVVIIRGGGAVADLSGFDTLALAENVANFPLPVITGIGHERDECVLDMVSHTRVKTPTAAAAFLINHLKVVADEIQECQRVIVNAVNHKMDIERMRLIRLSEHLPALFSLVKMRREAMLDQLFRRMLNKAQQKADAERERLQHVDTVMGMLAQRSMMKEKHRLAMLEQRLEAVDPKRLLCRGYSITLFQGKSVRDKSMLRPGDELETIVENGKIRSVVKE